MCAAGPLIGAVADDLTGATDLASALADRGMSTVLTFGVPDGSAASDPAPSRPDAVVLALKSRTVPADAARALARAAAAWFIDHGVELLYDKYCSTFDSSPAGNIGPVADALAAALAGSARAPGGQLPMVVHCPAYPVNGRTVHQGHLFVGSQLLSESPMRTHPLTPMTDANLLRVLRPQTPRPVALLPAEVVRAGPVAVHDRFAQLADAGTGHVLADAATDADLDVLAEALVDLVRTGRVLPAGGAPFGALVLARSSARRDADRTAAVPFAAPVGRAAVIAGSASAATQEQIDVFAATSPVLRLKAEHVAADVDGAVGAALRWAAGHPAGTPVLICADAGPGAVARAQAALGDAAAAVLERALAAIAVGLVDRLSVRRLVVAGGETSGAVAAALGIERVRVGPAIAPGVPWTLAGPSADGRPALALAFKSGNFGGPRFFEDALATLDAAAPTAVASSAVSS